MARMGDYYSLSGSAGTGEDRYAATKDSHELCCAFLLSLKGFWSLGARGSLSANEITGGCPGIFDDDPQTLQSLRRETRQWRVERLHSSVQDIIAYNSLSWPLAHTSLQKRPKQQPLCPRSKRQTGVCCIFAEADGCPIRDLGNGYAADCRRRYV
ncbi:unnamed protein product [Rangifer tarandus platyrhynchus]|uniref:Uncharacterized protein n=1 Tax=Rangifer tarandus platyrhynchus TaxID=3082113 RepID=A0ABN8XJ23_RANTA|nr:unnamed protein product [Rangifer tarandus platyrhynchus]